MIKFNHAENGGKGGPTVTSPVWAALVLQIFAAGVTISGTVIWMKADIRTVQSQLADHVRHQEDEDKMRLDIIQRLTRVETGVDDIRSTLRAKGFIGRLIPNAPYRDDMRQLEARGKGQERQGSK